MHDFFNPGSKWRRQSSPAGGLTRSLSSPEEFVAKANSVPCSRCFPSITSPSGRRTSLHLLGCRLQRLGWSLLSSSAGRWMWALAAARRRALLFPPQRGELSEGVLFSLCEIAVAALSGKAVASGTRQSGRRGATTLSETAFKQHFGVKGQKGQFLFSLRDV